MFNWRTLLPSLPDYPDNPLFRYEIRQVRWAETPARLKRYSLIVFFITMLIIILFWFLLTFTVDPSFRYPDRFLVTAENLLPFLILISIVANGLLDLYCVLMTANSFADEITARRWDLMRLAIMNPQVIVSGKYAVALCRVWRFVVVVTSLRVGAILVIIVRYGQSSIESETLGLFTGLLLSAWALVLEPLWRANAVTALLLDVAFARSSLIRAMGAGLRHIFAIWTIHLSLLGVAATVIIMASIELFQWFSFSSFIQSWVIPLCCLTLIVSVYWYYRNVEKKNALDNLLRRLYLERDLSN